VAAREKGKAEQFASDFDIPKVKIGEMESKNKSQRKIGYFLSYFVYGSMGAGNREKMGLSYLPARLQAAESIPEL
jgi:hypothetical protein